MLFSYTACIIFAMIERRIMEEGKEGPSPQEQRRAELRNLWVEHLNKQGERINADTFETIMALVDRGEAPPDVDDSDLPQVPLEPEAGDASPVESEDLSEEEIAKLKEVPEEIRNSYIQAQEILEMEMLNLPEDPRDYNLAQQFYLAALDFYNTNLQEADSDEAIQNEFSLWDDAKRRKYYEMFNFYSEQFAQYKDVGNTIHLFNTAEVYKKLLINTADDPQFVVTGRSKEKGEVVEEVSHDEIQTDAVRVAFNEIHTDIDSAMQRQDKLEALKELEAKWKKIARDHREELRRDPKGTKAIAKILARLTVVIENIKKDVPHFKDENDVTIFENDMAKEEFERQRKHLEKKEREDKEKKAEAQRLKEKFPKIIKVLKEDYGYTDDKLPSEEALQKMAEMEAFTERVEKGKNGKVPEGRQVMGERDTAVYEEMKDSWESIDKMREEIAKEEDWSKYGWKNKAGIIKEIAKKFHIDEEIAKKAATELLLYGQTEEQIVVYLFSDDERTRVQYMKQIGAWKSPQLRQSLFSNSDSIKDIMEQEFQHSPKNFHELAWQIAYVNDDEFGEYGENPVYSRKVERTVSDEGNVRFKVHQVINKDNLNLFPMWMVNTAHDQNPRKVMDFYEEIQIKKVPNYNALKLQEMLLNRGAFFTGSEDEAMGFDKDGKITSDPSKIIHYKVEDYRDMAQLWEIQAVLATVIRMWDIEYEGQMGQEKGVMESMQKFFYGNLMTKTFYGLSGWQWLLKLSEGFNGFKKMDTRVGAAVNTMFLAYANMSNFDKLREALGQEMRDENGNIIYEYVRDKDGKVIMETLRDDDPDVESIPPEDIVVKKVNKDTTIRKKKMRRAIYDISDPEKSPLFHLNELIKIRNTIAKKRNIHDYDSYFDFSTTLVDPKTLKPIINPATGEPWKLIDDKTHMPIIAIDPATGKPYEKDGKRLQKFTNEEVEKAFNLDGTIKKKADFVALVNLYNNQGKDPHLRMIVEAAVTETAKKRHHLKSGQATEFAGLLASHMPRWTGVASENDIGRAGFDAQTRFRKGYITKYFDGRGGLGYPQIAGLLNEWVVTYMNAIQTKDGRMLFEVLEDLAFIRRNIDSSALSKEEKQKAQELYDKRLEKVIFTANAERDWVFNHFARGLAIDDFLRGAAPIRLQDYEHHSLVGTTLNLQKYQQDIIKGVLTPWRYLVSTYGKLSFDVIRPGWDYELMQTDEYGKFQKEGWRDMPYAERMFGHEVLDIPEFWMTDEQGKYVYESYLDLNGKRKWRHKIDADKVQYGKKKLFKQGMLGTLAGQFLGEHQLRSWKLAGGHNWTYYKEFLEVLEKIPGNIILGSTMANTHITERFFTHEEIRWLRKHAQMTNMRLYSIEFAKALFAGDHKSKEGSVGFLGLAGLAAALGMIVKATVKQ